MTKFYMPTSEQKHTYFFSTMMGLMLSMSAPITHLFFLAFISFSWLYNRIVTSNSAISAFKIGLLFGFGYFLGGVYWSSYAPLMTDEPIKWVLSPMGVTLFPLYMAVYFGLAACSTKLINFSKLPGLLIFALIFTLADWCSGKIMGGFSMMTLSYIWSYSVEMMQSFSIFGTYGMTFILVFCTACIGPYLAHKDVIPCVLSAVILISMFTYGKIRLGSNPTEYNNNVYLRMVQVGSLNKPFKDNEGASQQSLTAEIKENLTLSNAPSNIPITHVIWPESSLPFTVIHGTNDLIEALSNIPAKYLITGGDHFVIKDNEPVPKEAYNTMLVIKKYHGIVEHYHKRHLVPFGEFFPLHEIIEKVYPGIDSIVGSFTHGKKNSKHIIKLDNTPPFTPTICYEIGFSDEVFEEQSEWIVNITNNGWFGRSSQSMIHLTSAIVRGVEFGIPVLITAKTGVSAVIDAYGRILDSLPTNYIGVIDTYLPKKTTDRTFYSKHVKLAKYITITLLCIVTLLSILRPLLSKRTGNMN